MADTIFYHCDVVTMVPVSMETEAVAVKDGKILAVGFLKDVMKYKTHCTELVDLRGQTLLPGLIEPHTHPIQAAIHNSPYRVDMSGFQPGTTREVLWAKLTEAVENTPNGVWIVGVGLNPILVKDFPVPTRTELDVFSTKHPIVLMMMHMHSVTCNSLAFQLAGVDSDTPDPPGGHFERDQDGKLTGIVEELSAIRIMLAKQSSPTAEEGREFLRQQLLDYSNHGYTTVAATGLFSQFPGAITSIEELVNSPGSPVRMVAYHREDVMLKKNPRKGTPGKDNFFIAGVKFWADGSPYGGTMATTEPYLDTKMTKDLHFASYPCCGMLIHTNDNLLKKMLYFHRQGWQIATHAQGERAIDQILETYQKLLDEMPREDHRYRLEHCGLITQDQLRRAKELGISLSLFVDHVNFFGHALRDDILGPERAARFMPLNWAKQAGHDWTLHSDTPCVPLGPFRSIKTAVTRQMREIPTDLQDNVLGPDQVVPIIDALKAYTVNASKQIQHEHLIGSIEVGKLADFTIVSKNLLKVKKDDIDMIEIVECYRNGKKVKPYNHKL